MFRRLLKCVMPALFPPGVPAAPTLPQGERVALQGRREELRYPRRRFATSFAPSSPHGRRTSCGIGVLLRTLAISSAALALTSQAARAADADLIAQAKKEGQVVWLGSLAVDDLARPLIDAFEKKYGVHVVYQRITVADIIVKVSSEAAAGRHEVDYVDGTLPSQALKKKGLLIDYVPEPAKRFPAELIDRDRQWVALNLYYATPAFNTDLLPKGGQPKTLDDLLDPKWRGKIAWSSVPGSATAAGFIGAVLRERGEEKGMEFLRALAQQKPIAAPVQARALLDQIIAGEYAIELQNFNSQVVVAKAKGAPVDWIPMNPATGVLIVGSVVKDAPHPAAAKLLFDFLVSPEGQAIFRDQDYVPADPTIAPKDHSVRPDGVNFRGIVFAPEEVEAEMPKWLKIFAEIFR